LSIPASPEHPVIMVPKKKLSRIAGFLLPAFAIGAAMGCLTPPGPLPGVLVFGFTGWLLERLWSFDSKRAGWKGFGFGYLVGAVSFAINLRWLAVVSPIGAIVLPLYLALFWGAFGAFASTLGNPFTGGIRRSNIAVTLATASVFAFLEWLRGWLFTGFGWNALGTVFHDSPWVAQSADLLGVSGISLLVIWMSGLLWTGLKYWSTEKSVRWDDWIAFHLIILLVPGYGWLRIHQEKSREFTPLRALLVQQNIPQDAARYLWDPAEIHIAYEDETLSALEKARAAGTFPDWVIWPESALTGRFLRTDDGRWGTWRENMESISNVREGGDFTLMFGSVELQARSEGDALVPKEDGDTWNSLVVMSPDDELQTFRKHHLVIFGETIPFVDSIPWLKEIYKQQSGVEYGGSFSAGKSFQPLSAPARGQTIGIIPTVCFEDTVPRLTRRFLKPGPQVIVNVTNDGWFKESIAAAQHFANARFRAIELRRPMIRCANTGVTASITPSGESRILTGPDGSHFFRGSMLVDVQVPLKPGFSLYGMIGDWGVILLGTGFLGGSVLSKRRLESRLIASGSA
jgi:apolipoprotein N-acyltransferase